MAIQLSEAEKAESMIGKGAQVPGTGTPTAPTPPPPTPTSATVVSPRGQFSATPTATHTLKGYDTNNNYAPVYVKPGEYVPGVSLYPKDTKDITTSNLGTTENKINLPTPEQPSTATEQAMITGANTTLSEMIKLITPEKTPEEQQQKSWLDEMVTLSGEAGKLASEKLTAQQAAGIPEMRMQFQDINAQILAKSAKYKILYEENLNKPITMDSIIGANRAAMNAEAADIGFLQAQAQGLQGKINEAQSIIDEAIDIKYKTIESRTNILQAQLDAIKPELNKQEKIQAQAVQLMIDNQRQALEDKKAEETNIQKVMLSAIEKGITDTAILDKIKNAQTYNDAISILGANMPTTASEDLQFISGTANQPSGVFNKTTGTFTPTGGGAVDSETLSLVQTIVANPELFSQLTPTQKAKVSPELYKLGFTAFGKPLSDTAIKEITQSEAALEGLQQLKQKILDNQQYIGPISGWAALNPWSQARQVQADIDRVKQVVGKSLEGGVLRKEDEEKYKKILATIIDTPETATYKINQLINDVTRNIETYKKNQMLSGRNVTEEQSSGTSADDILKKYGITP